MSDKIEKEFNLGGSVEKAIKGESELNVHDVLREAFSLTIKHFLRFTPAVVTYMVTSIAAFIVALNVLGYTLSDVIQVFSGAESIDVSVIQACFIAGYAVEVICSPLYASLSLMGMSQSAGLNTRFSSLLKGFQFTLPVILVTLISFIIQTICSYVFAPLSLYFSLAFTHAILLVCEKRMPPHEALLVSLKATNKKLFPLFVLFTISAFIFVLSIFTSGIGMIFVLPFYMHLKGTIYRNLFGVKLTLVSTPTSTGESKVFDA